MEQGEQNARRLDCAEPTLRVEATGNHSGNEMTSEDVVYNLGRPLDPKLQATLPSFGILRGFVPQGTTFEAKDKYTVVIKSPQPWVTVFDYFQVLNIMEKATAEGPNAA